MPVLILGGIYGGVFTPTEAAVVSVVYALPIALFVYRGIRLNDLVRLFANSAYNVGTLLVIYAFASVFSKFLGTIGVPQALVAIITASGLSKGVILLGLIIVILIVGMFMDFLAAMMLLAPMLAPTMVAIGVDLVHFSVILVFGFGVGLITPPVAYDLFVASRVSGLAVNMFLKETLPFLAVSVILFFVLTYIPELSLWLPHLVYGK